MDNDSLVGRDVVTKNLLVQGLLKDRRRCGFCGGLWVLFADHDVDNMSGLGLKCHRCNARVTMADLLDHIRAMKARDK